VSHLDQLSVLAQIALLPEPEREKMLADQDPIDLLYNWEINGRPSQLEATDSDARETLVLAGRGFGKTRIGSEWVRKLVDPSQRPTRGFLAARTSADVRDTLIQGESGLLNIFPPSQRPEWIASQRTVRFANGSTALCFSAKEPDQARGPQAHWALCDEWASWEFSKTEGELDLWENIRLATRLGSDPRIMAMTTPKRIKQVREMVAKALAGDQGVKLITGSTFENIALARQFIDVIEGLYGGTTLGQQELYGHVLDEIAGALWSEALINDLHTKENPGVLPLRVVAVDPSVAEQPTDECGIVVVGSTNEPNRLARKGWVLDDRSGIMAPSVWAKAVVQAAKDYDATVVAESNQGGAMVREMIHNVDKSIRVKLVHAKQSKKLRAEPISAVYEQRRVKHLGRFPDLENQMTGWVPEANRESPDRVDAMVHGFTALLLPSSQIPGKSSASNPGRNHTIATGAKVVSSQRRSLSRSLGGIRY
jgi:phage terminase large subunit-like protein